MAHTLTTSARVQRLTTLVAIVLVAVATGLAFGRVFQGGTTTLQLLAVGVGAGALAWALERRSLLLATLVSAAALVVVLAVVSFSETTWFGLPTLETLRQMLEAAGAVGEQARLQSSPAPPIDPLMLAGVTAVWASVFSCHALAFRAGSPLLALVPPVALVAFADTVLDDLVRPQYGLLFLVGGLAVAFADGLRRVRSWGPVWGGRDPGDRLVVTAGRGGRRLAVATIAAAAFLPLLVPGFGSAGLVDISSVNRGGRLQVDTLVSVAAELTRDEPIDVLSIRSEQVAYWRMLTLDRFDGITWRGTEREGPAMLTPGAPLVPIAGAETFRQEVEVLTDLDFPWLPVAAEPLYVGPLLRGSWDPSSSSISLVEPLDRGATYWADSSLVQPTPAELQRAEAVGTDPRFRQVPPDLPPVIRELADTWADEANAVRDYDVVLTIQQRLRDTTAFTYSTEVETRDDTDALVRFLTETRTGFCQQFASAMAVMLRSLDIPARIAVGFTPGTPRGDDGDVRTVTTENLHSWVEVYFDGHGWLAFEPTPRRSNPVAAVYQDPAVEDCPPGRGVCPGRGPIGEVISDDPGGGGVPRRNPLVDPTQREAEAGALPLGGDTNDEGIDRTVVLGSLVGIAFAALIAIPLVRRARRRLRLRRARNEPRRLVLATYDVFTQRAGDLGFGREPGETPDEYRRRIERIAGFAEGSLAHLTDLTVRAAYGAVPPDPNDAHHAAAASRALLRTLRRSTPLRQRVIGAYRRD
jgi:transglutaminase-like putative cysteine protease